MNSLKADLHVRKLDRHGSGEFGASRGINRKHNGIDFSCYPGTEIYPHRPGEVTKIGWPYSRATYRYVQVTDSEGYDWRYFYLSPLVKLGQTVSVDTIIGVVQDLAKRHEGITQHCHLEIKKDGKYIDPGDLR